MLKDNVLDINDKKLLDIIGNWRYENILKYGNIFFIRSYS